MAKRANQLSDLAVRKLKTPGVHADGGGLYLQVTEAGAKSWLYRYMLRGRERWMGLGSYPSISLSDARAAAAGAKRLARDGFDPIEHRRAERAARATETSTTFETCTLGLLDAKKGEWRNAKHEAQWLSTLQTYAYPVMGQTLVRDIGTEDVLRVLKPIWTTKTETASRVRQRIEAILDWARVKGYRAGENPARLRGHLDKLLPKKSKIQPVQHQSAMKYAELPAFFATLRTSKTTAARALAFTILTAARTTEVRHAIWPEIDVDEKTWSVAPERTKANRAHRVPLTKEALRILEELKPLRRADDELIFPGERPGKGLSENTMLKLLQDGYGYEDLTVHGFRSTFRDWAAETTGYPSDVAEAALAHVIKDKTQAAYQRGDLLERRREMMEAWANYCLSATGDGKVVAMRRKIG